MKQCQKCGKEFRTTIKVDGKIRNLNSRKFCLECSPFMQHNTKTLKSITSDPHKKICCNCKTEKNITDFYLLSSGYRFSRCIECTKTANRDKPREIKQKCIDYKGGKCEICGYSKYPGSLDFHHINSDEKEFSIGHRHNLNFDLLKKELDKCILVCKNCHCEIHGGIIKV